MCSMRYKSGLPIVNWHLKNLLFVFNFISWLAGLAMLSVGVYAKIDKSYRASGLSGVLDPVTPILVIGTIIFVITFFGCVGALRENLCMLRFFSYSLAVVLVFELGASFVALAMSGTVRYHIEELMHESIVHYRADPDLQNIIDWGQEEFKCCGVIYVTDWSQNIYFNCSDSNPSRERCSVPYSCCLPPDDDVVNTLCGIGIQEMDEEDIAELVYTTGCLQNFVEWLHSNMFLLACLVVAFGCIPQILGILISRILIIQIRDQDFYTRIGLLNPRGDFEFDWHL